jgi:hypothetical protein
VDQQANRRARSAPGATLNSGRLNGSQGVTSFLKVTGGCGADQAAPLSRRCHLV